MYFRRTKTILDYIIDQEYNEFKKQFAADETAVTYTTLEQDPFTLLDKYGTVITPTSINTESFKYLTSITGYSRRCVGDLFKSVTKSIIMVKGEYNFTQALNFIEKFIEKSGKHFYGALLRDTGNKDVIINPYHPQIALAAVKDSPLLTKTYKIILYFYRSRPMIESCYEKTNNSYEEAEKVVNALIRLSNPKKAKTKQIVVKVIESIPNEKLDYIEVTYGVLTKVNTSFNPIKQAFVTPHQILAKGTIAPYYGSSVLLKEPAKAATGIHITPLATCNINMGYYEQQNSVCTGNESSTTFKGLTVINHANLNSPFTTALVGKNAIQYIDLCIDKSREIYKKLGYLDSYTPISVQQGQKAEIPEEIRNLIKQDESALIEYLTQKLGYSIPETIKYILFVKQVLSEEENGNRETNK